MDPTTQQNTQLLQMIVSLTSSTIGSQLPPDQKDLLQSLSDSFLGTTNPKSSTLPKIEYEQRRLDGTIHPSPKQIINQGSLSPIILSEKPLASTLSSFSSSGMAMGATTASPFFTPVTESVLITVSAEDSPKIVLGTRVVGTEDPTVSTRIFGEVVIPIVGATFEVWGSKARGRIGNPDQIKQTAYYEPAYILAQGPDGLPQRIDRETEVHIQEIPRATVPAGSNLYWLTNTDYYSEQNVYIQAPAPPGTVIKIISID